MPEIPIPSTGFTPLRRSPWGRLGRLGVGTVVMGLGIALLLRSRLGLVPPDVLHVGVATACDWSLGGGIIATQSVLLMMFVPLRLRPGIGTLAAYVLPAITADAVLSVLPTVDLLAARVVAMVVGAGLFCCGVALYLGTQLGHLPRDAIMLALCGDRQATGA